MRVTCGIDWSERHHDVALVDAHGRVLVRRRVGDDLDGFRQLMELLAEHCPGEEGFEVAVETDQGLLVTALAAAGVRVYPINPRAVARYRERYGQAGGKSDPGDAVVLANILRTDRHVHRPLPADSELARAVKTAARQHQEAIWARQQMVNRLRSLLREYYPSALVAFPNLTHRTAVAVLSAAPTPAAARTLTPQRIVDLLREVGRRNDPGLAERICARLGADALRQPAEVEQSFGVAAAGLLSVIAAMTDTVTALHHQLGQVLARHRQAKILASLPGLGRVLGGRVLGELGDDPRRFGDIAGVRGLAGTAPITRASGKIKQVNARRIRNHRLADACHWWAYAALTRSAGVRSHYDRRRAAGDSHNAALRNVANKLLAKLWHCLRHDVIYDESRAWPTPDQSAAAA